MCCDGGLIKQRLKGCKKEEKYGESYIDSRIFLKPTN